MPERDARGVAAENDAGDCFSRARRRLAPVCAFILLSVGLPTVVSAIAAALPGPPPAMLVPTANSIVGRVFRDDNGNGAQDNGEFGVGGITAKAYNDAGNVATAVTDGAGNYRIDISAWTSLYWRVEIQYQNASFPRYASRRGTTNKGALQIVTRGASANFGFIDSRFYGAQAQSCYQSLLSSAGTNAVHMYVGTTGVPLHPTLAQPPAQAFLTNGALKAPVGLAFDPRGDIWVTSTTNDRVYQFNGITGQQTGFITDAQLKDPRGVAFGWDGNLYVTGHGDATTTYRQVLKFDGNTGAYLGVFITPASMTVSGTVLQPQQGIVFAPDGFVYVSAETPAGGANYGRVMKFTTAGAFTGTSWVLDAIPRNINVGSDGNLYVAASQGAANGGVWKIDLTAGTASKVLAAPYSADVSFGPDGNAYVVNENTTAVNKYSFPAFGSLGAYIGAAPGGGSQSAPKQLLWWRGDTACAGMSLPFEIGNRVWNDTDGDGLQDPGEPGAGGVTVTLYTKGVDNTWGTGDDVQVASQTTDGWGSYLFTNVSTAPAGGSYQVRIGGGALPAGTAVTLRDRTPINDGLDDWRDSDAFVQGGTITVSVPTPTLVAPIDHHTYDFGIVSGSGRIGNRVWNDLNNSGTIDAGETGIANVRVYLVNSGAVRVQSTWTDSSGYYLFGGLANGGYTVQLATEDFGAGGTYATWVTSTGTSGSATGPNEPAPSPDNNTDNNDDGSLQAGPVIASAALTLTAGGEPTNDGDDANGNLTVDFGVFKPYTVSGRVWSDDNRNGIRDGVETVPLTTSYTVHLRDSNAVDLSTTTTDASGNYQFSYVGSALDTLKFDIPSGYKATLQDQGSDDTIDSDGNSSGITAPFRPEGAAGGAVMYDPNSAAQLAASSEITTAGIGVNLTAGASTTVEFWMKWDGTSGGMPISWGNTDLWFNGGHFGFNTYSSDVRGVLSPALANVWVHVAAVFVNNNPAADQLYINGALQTLTLWGAQTNRSVTAAPTIGGGSGNSYLFGGKLDEFVIYDGALAAGTVLRHYQIGTGTVIADYRSDVLSSTPLAYWRLSDAADPSKIAVDSSVNAKNGTYPASGIVNSDTSARSFDMGLMGFTIGDQVWRETNDDGLQQVGEVGVSGVTVQLRDASGATLATRTTDGAGKFTFKGLGAASYSLAIPRANLTTGALAGMVSSGGFVANAGAKSYEPAPAASDGVDSDDNGTYDIVSGDVTTSTFSIGFDGSGNPLGPVIDDGDPYTYNATDFGFCASSCTPAAGGPPINNNSYRAAVLGSSPIGYWRLGEASGTSAADAAGTHPGSYVASYTLGSAGALLTNDSDTSTTFAGGTVSLTSLPVNVAANASTTVEFWMYWNGGNGVMPFGWGTYDLWLTSGYFGFNNGCSNVFGVSSTGLANRWVHVTAVFVNGNLPASKLYLDGVLQNSTAVLGTWTCAPNYAYVAPAAQISGWTNSTGYRFSGRIDEVAIYNSELAPATITAHYNAR